MLTAHYNLLVKQIKENAFDFFKFDQLKINKFCDQSKNISSKYKNVVIIGMGASILNIKTICNIKKLKKNIIYLNSLHALEIEEKLSKINLDNTVFFSISKSGNTHETLIITEYIIKTKKVNPKNIYIISPCYKRVGDNLLYNLSEKHKLNHLSHDIIGSGRFNIISETTLLPAAYLGIDIARVLSGAIDALSRFLLDGSKVIDAAIWYLNNYNLSKTILVMFSYSYRLRGFLEWKQQILSESLGKNGFGITPIISNGTFDEHSQLQLYLEGPDDKFFEIITEGNLKNNPFCSALSLHSDNVYQSLVIKKKLVNLNVINDLNEEKITHLIVDTILITILIAMYKNINPFDQLSVDTCKVNMQASIA